MSYLLRLRSRWERHHTLDLFSDALKSQGLLGPQWNFPDEKASKFVKIRMFWKLITTKKQFEKDWVKEGILRAPATLIGKNWKNGEIGKRNIKCFPSTRVHTSATRFQNASFLAKMNTVRFSENYEKRSRKVLFWVDNSSCLVWTKGCKINQSIVVFTRRDLTSF